MNETQLREAIRAILEGDEDKKKPKKKKNLLVEPDKMEKSKKDAEASHEVSAGGVQGVAVPLGAGPHYPAPDSPAVKRIRKQIDVVGRAFGGAKPTKKKK